MSQDSDNFERLLSQTDYFQESIENLLRLLQPSFYCLDLIIKILIHGPDGSGKRLLTKIAADKLGMKFIEERVSDLFDENIVGTEKKVRSSFSRLSISAPCVFYLNGYELLCKLEDVDLDRIEHCIRESLESIITDKTQPVIFIASTNSFHQVYKTPLSDIFQHDICMKSVNSSQAVEILNSIRSNAGLTSQPATTMNVIDGEYYVGNLVNMLAQTEISSHAHVMSSPNGLEYQDISSSTESANEGTRWLDIGGLSDVKKEIVDAIQLSIDFPQLKKSGLRRTGILLYGPPGTGKTLLAKAVATECSLRFINVKGPELLNEYVGQSEDNIRRLFQKARESSPAVIFFDELDSLAPNRGLAGDSGGVMDRMVSQILAEMDGVGKSESVFVIGATNRVDLVDPSLLRPGRFDKVLEVPLPIGKESRLQILRAVTRKLKLSDDVDLDRIESLAPKEMSGADFQGLCSRALHKTFDRCIELVESGQMSEENVEFVTNMEDFLISLDAYV